LENFGSNSLVLRDVHLQSHWNSIHIIPPSDNRQSNFLVKESFFKYIQPEYVIKFWYSSTACVFRGLCFYAQEKPSSKQTHEKPSSKQQPQENKQTKPPQEEDENYEEDEEENETYCGICGGLYSGAEFWIGCDLCEKWYHGKCVKITAAKAEHIEQYKCPACMSNKRAHV
jgi:hypothetical protein